MGSNQTLPQVRSRCPKTFKSTFSTETKTTYLHAPETFGDMCDLLGVDGLENNFLKTKRKIKEVKYDNHKSKKPSQIEFSNPGKALNLKKINVIMNSFNSKNEAIINSNF